MAITVFWVAVATLAIINLVVIGGWAMEREYRFMEPEDRTHWLYVLVLLVFADVLAVVSISA